MLNVLAMKFIVHGDCFDCLFSFQDNQKKEIQQLDCIDIVKYKNNQSLDHIPDRPNLGLYGNRKSTFRFVQKL